MNFRMKFPCSKCGACCRKIGRVCPDLEGPDGSCIYLSSDNLCSIYQDRPIFCNIDKFYDKYFKDKMSREEFYELNLAECKKLQDDDTI